MKRRVLSIAAVIGFLALAVLFFGGSAGASAPNNIPAGVPVVTAVGPLAHNRVHAGEKIFPNVQFQGAIRYPHIVFDYQSAEGADTGLAIDWSDYSITVPAGWNSGRYKLRTVEIQDGRGPQAIQLRSGKVIGFVDAFADPTFGNVQLDMRSMTLNVVH